MEAIPSTRLWAEAAGLVLGLRYTQPPRRQRPGWHEPSSSITSVAAATRAENIFGPMLGRAGRGLLCARMGRARTAYDIYMRDNGRQRYGQSEQSNGYPIG